MTHIDVYLYAQKNRLMDICKSNLIYTGRYSYKAEKAMAPHSSIFA